MRLAAVRAELARRVPRAGALLVSGAENRRYLSGFRGDAGWLLVSPGDAALLTDSRFWDQAGQEAPDWRLVRVAGRPGPDFLAAECRASGITTLAFEPEAVTYGEYRDLRRHLSGVRLVPVPGLLEALRQRKDAAELAAIRAAAAVTDRAFARWLPLVVPGAREDELARELEYLLRLEGAEASAFPPIVAAGPRGAMAHAIPGPEALQAGDLVVCDLGCRVDGYCSDMTRTVAVPGAEVGAEALRVHALVAAALAAGLQAVRPGATGVEVDAAARAVIVAGGHGPDFGHGLGHGVGLAVHEGPRLSPLANPRARLPEGAVVTIEPGVYLPGRFGVRLEELVLVARDGPEIISASPLGLRAGAGEGERPWRR